VPRLCEFYPGICLTAEERAWKNLSQGKKNLSQVKKNLKVQYTCITIRITNRCAFLYYVFISFFSFFFYMFRAFMGPSSGVFQAVVFMLPFGSCSALLIACVRQQTLSLHVLLNQMAAIVLCSLRLVLLYSYKFLACLAWMMRQTINKALHEPNGSIKTTA